MVKAQFKCDGCGYQVDGIVQQILLPIDKSEVSAPLVLAPNNDWISGHIQGKDLDFCAEGCLQDYSTRTSTPAVYLNREGEEQEVKPQLVN